ncbi:extracellular solute-binding protein [Microbacterium sp. LTA6]|uniref:ABC transporter substrate-binding protein n=1 Tax=unclassified Microbacterium TaxID=2609290 RepID=UPI00324C298F
MKAQHTAAAASAIALALGLTLVGCAPGSGGQSASEAQAVSTDVGSEKVTIKIVSTPESGAPLPAIIEAFNEKYPNITVEHQETTFDEYNKQLPLQLASNSSPDIVLVNITGNLAKDGLILNLNDYVDAYGWDDVYSAGQLGDYAVGEDLVSAGGANQIALPTGFFHVGVYYNKELLAKAGVTELPQSLEEFEAALAKAKNAGVLPIQFGNAQGHAGFTIQEIGQSTGGASEWRDWVWGKPGNTFDTPANRTAVDKLVEWNESGYFPSSTEVNGTDLGEAVGKFTAGEGMFFIDGNWDSAAIDDAMGENAGFFSFPGTKPTGAGGSIAYAISEKSKHKNAAAAFLDFFHSSEASAAIFAAGFLPQDTSKLSPKAGVIDDIVNSFAATSAADGSVTAFAGATVSMNDTFIRETQDLIAGRTTASELIEAVQQDWDSVHG